MSDLILPFWCKPLRVAGNVQDRTLGLGGTDMAAIVGLSPWATAFDIWLDKKGSAPKKEQTQAMSWGNRAEPMIASAYADETQAKILKVGVTLAGKDKDWLIGSPDYLSTEKALGLDCKNIRFKSAEWGEPGSDKVPEYYLIQMAWYMALTGAESWDIPVLFGGCDFQIFTVGRNEKLESALLERAEEWWTRYVVGKEEPAIEDSPKVREWIKSKYPRNMRPMRKATVEEAVLAVEFNSAKERLKAVKETVESFETKLKAAIGEDEGLELPNGKATWRNNKDGYDVDWEAIARTIMLKTDPAERDALISKHTITKPGARVLRVLIKE